MRGQGIGALRVCLARNTSVLPASDLATPCGLLFTARVYEHT
jgi:hypothetical protein